MKWKREKDLFAIKEQNWEIATQLKCAEKEIEQLKKEIVMWKERGDRLSNAYDSRSDELAEMQKKFTQMVTDSAYVKYFSEGVKVMRIENSEKK